MSNRLKNIHKQTITIFARDFSFLGMYRYTTFNELFKLIVVRNEWKN